MARADAPDARRRGAFGPAHRGQVTIRVPCCHRPWPAPNKAV